MCEWLATDEHDQGYKHLNEDEIIETIVQQNNKEEEGSDGEGSHQNDTTSRVRHGGTAVKSFD